MSSPITQVSDDPPSALANLITQVSPDQKTSFALAQSRRPGRQADGVTEPSNSPLAKSTKTPLEPVQPAQPAVAVVKGSTLQPTSESPPPSSNTHSDITSKNASTNGQSQNNNAGGLASFISLFSCCSMGGSSRTDKDNDTKGTNLKTFPPRNGNGAVASDGKVPADEKIITPGPDSIFAAGAPADGSGAGENALPMHDDITGQPALLPALSKEHKGRKCLVLDLDETLVHSSFKLIHNADFVVPVEIEQQVHNVYVIKRPGVDQFMEKMGEIYEIVVFTASLSKYANPVLDMLDIHHVVHHRLFRESCYNHNGNYVKDLSMLGRPLEEIIILDNSPASYLFHPTNAVPVSSWFNDPHDTELVDLCPFLAELSEKDVGDVRGVLDPALEDA